MPAIHLTTVVHAPIQRVFDLSRSIDLHRQSMNANYEEAIAGIVTGLIGLHQTVTWQARHLFKVRTYESLITAFEPPHFFSDEMLNGDFVRVKHDHHFKPISNGTIMIDVFEFTTPFKWLGQLCNQIYLTRYLTKLLLQRNKLIKEVAETNKWKSILP